MSFDTEFDYTNAIARIDAITDDANTDISAIDTQISNLQAINSEFDGLTADKLEELTSDKARLETKRGIWLDTRADILALSSLSSQDKTTIYNFYTNHVAEDKNTWMTRIPDNYTGIITDANNVLSSGNITGDEANSLAEIICGKYRPGHSMNRLHNYI